MKKTICFTIIVLLIVSFSSCTDQDSLIDGRNNAYKLKYLRISLEQNPTNKDLQDSIKLYEMYMKINKENYASYGMGSNNDFDREIERHLKYCKKQ